jgi:hypothetical protein
MRGPMGAIKNFGHFWSAKDVNWNTNEDLKKGHARRKGDLRGYSGRGKNKEIIDFRSQIGVYVLFAENREVIYVGQAGVHEKRTIFGRLRRHRRDHLRGRWGHFSWFGLCAVDHETKTLKPFETATSEGPRDALDEIEATLIHLFEPRLNLQRRKWKHTREYLQYIASEDDSSFVDDEEEDE